MSKPDTFALALIAAHFERYGPHKIGMAMDLWNEADRYLATQQATTVPQTVPQTHVAAEPKAKKAQKVQ